MKIIMKPFDICRNSIKMQRFQMQSISLGEGAKVIRVSSTRAFLTVGWWGKSLLVLSLQNLPLNQAQGEPKER